MSLEIFVKGFEGKTITLGSHLGITLKTSISKLKDIVSNQLNLDKKKISLIFQTKQLEDNFDLFHYNIEDKSTLFIVSAVLGGMKEQII